TSAGNKVLSNLIGTNAAGTLALPNAGNGVFIDGGTDNLVAYNVLAGNKSYGVSLEGINTFKNTVAHNFISNNEASGTLILGNERGGVLISEFASNNTIQDNVISGNDGPLHAAVEITDIGTAGNKVLDNKIGTNAKGTLVVGNVVGVYIHS